MFALAVLAAALALLPRLGEGGYGFFGTTGTIRMRSARSPRNAGDQDTSGYVGIVLWPPHPMKKAKIVPPPPLTHSIGAWNSAKPLVIPFDGPYWYFKAPAKRPGPKARLFRAKPTLVNIHSTDWQPLLMEAHQNLSSSINLDCCKEMDVTITNADNRPGRIAIGIILTSSASPEKLSQYLGEKPIASSEAPYFSMILVHGRGRRP